MLHAESRFREKNSFSLGLAGRFWENAIARRKFSCAIFGTGCDFFRLSVFAPTTDVTTKGGVFFFEKWSKSSKTRFLSPKCRETLLLRWLVFFLFFYLFFAEQPKFSVFLAKSRCFAPHPPLVQYTSNCTIQYTWGPPPPIFVLGCRELEEKNRKSHR